MSTVEIPERVDMDDLAECHARLTELEASFAEAADAADCVSCEYDRDVFQAGRLVLERALEAEG